MSDTPPPPQFPSPPPPSAPPGYAAYEPTNWGAGLSRVRGLYLAISGLLAVFGLGTLASIFLSSNAQDAARDFVAGRIDEDAFEDEVAGSLGGGFLLIVAQIALVVVSVIWLYRVVRNVSALGRRGTWGPGWAIAGWLLPPFLFVIPLLVLREAWTRSLTDPRDDPRRDVLLAVWFVLYSGVSVGSLAMQVRQASAGDDAVELAQFAIDTQGLSTALAVVALGAVVAWYLVVRGLTRRHVALTGEDRSR
jgi:hypothetical protein